MRAVAHSNDLHDGWTYWGYGLHQHPIIINRIVHGLLNGPKGFIGLSKRLNHSCAAWSARAPMRLFAEHHYSRHSLEAILGTLKDQELKGYILTAVQNLHQYDKFSEKEVNDLKKKFAKEEAAKAKKGVSSEWEACCRRLVRTRSTLGRRT